MSKRSYNKNERQLDSICHQKKQPTIFQLKGVVVLSEFDKASKVILDENSSDRKILQALKIFNSKKPTRDWFDNNDNVCKRISVISKKSENEAVKKLAKELKTNWKAHHSQLNRRTDEYQKMREKSKKMMADKLPSIKRVKIDEIELYIHNSSCSSSSTSKSSKDSKTSLREQLKYKSRFKGGLGLFSFRLVFENSSLFRRQKCNYFTSCDSKRYFSRSTVDAFSDPQSFSL